MDSDLFLIWRGVNVFYIVSGLGARACTSWYGLRPWEGSLRCLPVPVPVQRVCVGEQCILKGVWVCTVPPSWEVIPHSTCQINLAFLPFAFLILLLLLCDVERPDGFIDTWQIMKESWNSPWTPLCSEPHCTAASHSPCVFRADIMVLMCILIGYE